MAKRSRANEPMNLQTRQQIYRALMNEARHRIGVINHAYQNEAQFPPAMMREICYLQFRFLCEIIALGGLVAHGHISDAQALTGHYEPTKIIKGLERINPHFYPQPMEVKVIDGVHHHIGRPDVNCLQKRELPKLWAKAGSIVHRGTMERLYDPKKHPEGDWSDIFEWTAKLTGLLNCHWITLEDNKNGMLVTLKCEDTGEAAVTFFDFRPDRTVTAVVSK